MSGTRVVDERQQREHERRNVRAFFVRSIRTRTFSAFVSTSDKQRVEPARPTARAPRRDGGRRRASRRAPATTARTRTPPRRGFCRRSRVSEKTPPRARVRRSATLDVGRTRRDGRGGRGSNDAASEVRGARRETETGGRVVRRERKRAAVTRTRARPRTRRTRNTAPVAGTRSRASPQEGLEYSPTDTLIPNLARDFRNRLEREPFSKRRARRRVRAQRGGEPRERQGVPRGPICARYTAFVSTGVTGGRLPAARHMRVKRARELDVRERAAAATESET